MPWLYVRRVIAKAWGVAPYEVEFAPRTEIELELQLLELDELYVEPGGTPKPLP